MFPGVVIDVVEDYDQFRSTLNVEPGKVETNTIGVRRDVLRHSSGWTELSLGQADDPHDGVAGETAVELLSTAVVEQDRMLRHAAVVLCCCPGSGTLPAFRD